MHQQQEGRDDVFQSAQHETDRQLILAAAPTSAALDGGEEIWKRNPYPATNPKHNEFRRQVRTQTIDRMGPRAAKSMRLSDFVADEYRSELASSAEHRHKQQYIAVNGGGSESAGGGVVVPYRSASTASSSISLAPAASKLRGFREPLPPRVQSRPVTEFSTTTTKDRESMPATKGCRISCAVTLHGSKSVWVALSDGTVRIHERQPHPPHRPVTSFKDTDNKPGVRSIDVRQQFLDDERASRRTQLAGKECGVMGTEEQCAHGSWASKRLHRSIDHLTVKSSSEATDSHDAPRLLATCMEVLGQRYVALGISTGDIHVWDALTGEGVVMMHTTTTTTPTATQPSAAAHAVHLAFLSSRQKDLPFPEPQAENDPMDEGDDRRSQLSLTQAPPKSVADASQEREEFFFSIVFSDGTVAVACFDEGMGITCNPPPCASSSSSAAGTSTTITATLSLVCLRPRLIKSSFHRNAIGISTDCASMYIADAEGTMYMIDVDDLQVSAKWELRTICAFQQQDSGSKQQLPSHAMSRGNRGVTAALNASAANAAVVAASLPQSTPFSWTSPDCPPIATSLDCLDSLIAIGFESGEVILLERRKRAQTRSTLAFVHGLRLSSTSTDAGINANTSKQSNGTKAVGALKIAAWTNEVWVATRSKEMYVVSLDPHLGYSLVNKISLLASAADDATPPPPPPSDTTGAVAGCCTDTLSTTINLSLHCHLDAMEVWSAGADDANYTWMTDLSRTREEVHQNIQLLHARGFTDESSLVQWRDATSKKEKATSAALDGAVGDLLMTAQHALYRRYYWMWRHFRLEHQLRKKQPTLGSILGRIMLTTLGRSYFTTWCSYRNRHRTWKREGHVAATLECVKRRQLQQGAMIVWERFAAMRKRLRQGETASMLLAKQTQRRHMCTSFMRWVSFTRRQHIQRRWTAFAVTQSKTLLVSLQRRCFGNWMLYRQQRYECRQREACAEGLIPHSQKSLLACSWTTWLALCALRRQQRVLSHWSNSVDASASEVTAGKAYQAWLMLVHERREARATAKLDQYTQKEKNLEQSIAIAAPRLQRLRKLVALKQRVSSLKERADELRTIEESLEDRVISLRVSTIPPDVRRMFSSASIIIRHGEERSNNGSTVGGTMSGITDSPDRMAGGAAIDNEDSSSPKEGAQDTATGGSGGDVTELISSAVWASFPSVMERLKRRVIDLAWDVPLIVSTVDRVRGSQLKSFHHAVLGAEKIIRGLFASHVTTTTTATGSGSTVTNEFTREESARQATNASPLRPWVPETVTESALRKAVIRLVEEDPNAAHTLQNTIKTFIIAYDCMPPKEKRNDVDARDSSAVVHHEELLTIVADALARSLAMRREQQQQQQQQRVV